MERQMTASILRDRAKMRDEILKMCIKKNFVDHESHGHVDETYDGATGQMPDRKFFCLCGSELVITYEMLCSAGQEITR